MRPQCGSIELAGPGTSGHKREERGETARLLTLMGARPLVLTLAVGLGVATDASLFVRGTKAGLAVLVACYALTGLYLLLASFKVHRGIQLGLQVAMDAAIITVLVAITGGPESQYVLLYFLVILYASMYASFRGALATGVLCSGAYLFLWWPQLVPSHTHGAEQTGTGGTVAILFNCALFVAVGVLGGFLARRVEQKDRKLKDATRELQRIRLGTDVILESMGSGIMSIDSEGKIVHCNRTAASILGLDAVSVRNEHYGEILTAGLSGLAQHLRLGLEQGVTVFRGEAEISTQSGRRIPLGINTSLIATEGGKRAGVVALYQDLTEAKKIEEKNKRQETLAALGQFSAGIAHEIRNCLSPIVGCAELLKKEASLDGDAQRLMGLILKEIERLEVFLSELLFYARAKQPEVRDADLQELIEETVELVKRHPIHSADKLITCGFHAPATRVRVDVEQFKRVFVNLLVNALEALECGGEATVRTYPDETGSTGTGETGSCVVVEIEDNGVGIPPESLHRVLEPFYSTKGAGTGLGLSIAQRVIERHNGKLSIESRVGKGTKVRVHIPCVAADTLDMACHLEKTA